MKFFVPTIGTVFTLTKNWEFDIHSESRNYDLWKLAFPNEVKAASGTTFSWSDDDFYAKDARKFAFKKGSVFKIDRIYIRKGKAEYDSISFVLQHDSSGEITRKPRFWAKLVDVNTITCELGDLRK